MSAADSKRWSNFVFAGLFALAVVLFSRILLPFVMPVLLGGFLVVLFLPIQDFLCRRLKGRKGLSALLSTLTVFLLILVPLAGVGWLVGRELFQLATNLPAVLERVDVRQELITNLPRGLSRYVRSESVGSEMEKGLLSAATGSATVIKHAVGMGSEFVVNLFLMTVAMYYFFLDGRRLYAEAIRLVPLERRYIQHFSREFTDVGYAIVYGNTVTALVQGAVGLVGLLIAGVPHAVVWGAAMVIAALVPVVGTGLVWVPISLLLFLSGKTSDALFLAAWGSLVVGTVDNFIRPRLCGSRMALHPLIVFLSMFGGVAVFGMMGMLVGPLIAAFFMAMVRIYRRDFLGLTQPAVFENPGEPPATATPAPSAMEATPILAPAVLEAAPSLAASPIET
ncbi:AI-2E family transporter [Hyalangium versicolor]|uniref:AI-2E family transporter n=1 Tax=Hyalangium versicolor TaxID=2861190 RepID=UPI001CCD0F0A|nr:AI-2E family transporter [Hyalangium versicolor]